MEIHPIQAFRPAGGEADIPVTGVRLIGDDSGGDDHRTFGKLQRSLHLSGEGLGHARQQIENLHLRGQLRLVEFQRVAVRSPAHPRHVDAQLAADVLATEAELDLAGARDDVVDRSDDRLERLPAFGAAGGGDGFGAAGEPFRQWSHVRLSRGGFSGISCPGR